MSATWSPVAELDLHAVGHWRREARIAKAVYHFAATGEGVVQRDESGRRIRLVVGSFVVLMTLEPSGDLTVWRVFRR